MKNKQTINTRAATSACGRMSLLASVALTTLASLPASAWAERSDDGDHYQQINLVSDIAGVAQVQDTNLVNGWGISFHPGFAFWVSDNGTGKTTLYSVTNDASGAPHARLDDGSGNPSPGAVPLVVSIPGDGTPTGQVANSTDGFNGDLFLFASEDGTISGWRPDLGNA